MALVPLPCWIAGPEVPAVLPILPAAAGLLVALVTGFLGTFLAAATFKPQAMKRLTRAVWRQKWGILVLALLAGLAVEGRALFRSRDATVPVPLDATTAHWPKFRGSPDRTGHADDVAGPSRGGVHWSGGRSFEFLSSPALAGDEVVAVGCQGDTARFFGWDAETGKLAWTFAPPGYRATFSSPVLANGRLVCGEGLHWTPNSRVISLELQRAGDRDAIRTFSTRSHVECTPVLADGRIYVNAGDDGIYCLAQHPTELRVVWHVAGERYADAETSLAVAEGRVYVGLGVGGEALCLLDAGTGRELARVDLPLPVFSPPAIIGGRVYVGLGRADYVNEDDTSPGAVWCLDSDSLALLWKVSTPSAVLAAIAVDGGDVVFNTVDGQLLVIDDEGHERGRWRAGARMLTAPAVTGQMVYCVANDGLLTGLERRQLTPVWSVRLGQPGRYTSSPLVYRGRIYVGTPGDGFVCVGEPLPAAHSDVWRSHLGGPGRAGAGDASHIPDDAAVVGTVGRDDLPDPVDVTAAPAVTSRDLVVPLASRDWSGLICTESPTAGRPGLRWTFDGPAPIRVSPAISETAVVCVCGEPDNRGELIVLDRTSGTIVSRRPVERVSNTLVAEPHSVLVADDSRCLRRFSLAGEPVWEAPVGRLDQPIDFRDDLIVGATVAPERLFALDGLTGQVLWQSKLRAAPIDSPVISGLQVVAATRQGIEFHSLLDGTVQRAALEWSATAPVSIETSRIVGTTDEGEIVFAEARTGIVQHRVKGARPGMPPLAAGNAVVFAADDFHLWKITHETAEPWFETSQFGPVSQPLILRNGRVYVSVAGTGVLCLDASGR